MIAFGAFQLDTAEERLWKGKQQLAVRRKPFAILAYLVANPRRLVTHEELLQHVWGGAVVSESAVRTHLHELRQLLGEGVIETVIGRGYRFAAALATETPAPAEQPPTRTLIGRDEELAALDAALEQARGGHRQLRFVSGEPGIGKTTLLDAFVESAERGALVLRGHCVEQHGTPEAYLAVIEMFGRLRHELHRDALSSLVRFAPTFVSQIPHLIPDAQLDEVTRRAAGGSEAKMVRELLEAIEAIASQQLVVVVLEDLQWSDLATLDLLALLGQRRERAKLLVVVTARRAEAQTVTHPLNRVMRGLIARSGAQAIALDRLAGSDIRALLDARFAGHTFPAPLVDVVDRITNGTPLFVNTLFDDLVERGMLVQRDGPWQLAVSLEEVALHRPDSLKQLIDIQLDRLTPEEQRALEAGSVLGLEIATTLVAAALELPEEQVDEIYDSLARRSLFLRRATSEDWPDGTLQTRYAMMHGLVHEVCLDRSAPARRQRWHRLIAERLETAYGERAGEVAHVLAVHFEHGQVAQRAMHYYFEAGGRTARRFASSDAMALFERAYAFIARLPASADRDRMELRILQGLTSTILRGHHKQPTDPLAKFERMIALARVLGDRAALCGALVNASIRLSTLGEYRRAMTFVDEVDSLERDHPLDANVIEFRDTARVVAMIWQGELVAALEHLERLVPERFDAPQFDVVLPDRSAVNLAYLTLVRWLLGYPETALREAEQACRLADASSDPWTVGLSYCNFGRLLLMSGATPAQVRPMAAHVLATPLAGVWHGPAGLLAAWADAHDGTLDSARVDDMLSTFRERLHYQPMGPTHLSLPVIGALRAAGKVDAALGLVAEILVLAETRNERVVESELVRIRGELVEAIDPAAAATDYRQAIVLAKARSARSLELRAAMRLARLEPTPTTRAELAAVLATFTEGFETPDLREAKRTLDT